MDSSTLLYIAVFFFILGAGIVGLSWIIVTLVRGVMHREKGSSSQDPDLSVMARLMRDIQTQDLVVEMDGKTFRSVSDLSPAQQRRLSFTASVLAKWLSQPNPAIAQASPDQSLPALMPDDVQLAEFARAPEPATQPVPPAEPMPVAEVEPFKLDQLPDNGDWIPADTVPTQSEDRHFPPFASEPTPEVKPVSTKLPDVVGGILNPTPTPAPVYKSIAMQINDILQVRISGTPFEKRGITVSDGPEHGVQVTLDGQKYPGVKDVPDDEVRNLIRSSVLEWEKMGKSSSK
jgi:hypothetical protein